MALDLVLGAFWITLASVLSFWAVRQSLKHATWAQRAASASSLVVLGGMYVVSGWDQLWLSRLIPTSALVMLGNWFPILASGLAGIASRMIELPTWRRNLATSGMLFVATFALVFPLIGETPVCGQLWRDNICRQTTPFTCSAASATTLLNQHGIAASEAEMAELCLTNALRQGTSWQGLYRGLVLKTARTKWRVEVFQSSSVGLHALQGTPAILVACLPHDGHNVNPIYRDACGWVPGQAHAVVYLGDLDTKTAIVGDPQFGRELWTESDLKILWTGLGFRLVPRD